MASLVQVWKFEEFRNKLNEKVLYKTAEEECFKITRDGSKEVTQRAHDVNTTSQQRRCIDVEPTLYKRHVPAGYGLALYTRRSGSFCSPKMIPMVSTHASVRRINPGTV